ncbi:MAG: hypothetical protein WCT85_06575 [Parachlamydiales bacterium]|jgi:hypothetical protein
MTTTFLESIKGWRNGYLYTFAKTSEDEIRQGKDHRLAAFAQYGQVLALNDLVYKMSKKIPLNYFSKPIKVLCNITPILSLPVCYGLGIIRSEDNSLKFIPKDTLIFKGLYFLAQYSGDLIRVAMIVGSIALINLGCIAYGSGILTAMTYEFFDNYLGLVPFKISLFMEKIMPIISAITGLFNGIYLTRIISAIDLSSRFSPSINKFVQHKFDFIIHKIFSLKSPTLEETEKPLEKRKEFSSERLNEILDAPDSDFRINLSHCSKFTNGSTDLPRDNNFNEFLRLFDEVKWTEKYSFIKTKLTKDKIFRDHLEGQIKSLSIDFSKDFNKANRKFLGAVESLKTDSNTANIQDYRNTKKELDHFIDEAIILLAKKENISKELYLERWIKKQLETLVSGLYNKTRMKGSQKDTEDSIVNCSKILTYLKSLNRNIDRIDFEDILLSLAVDGGDYCARGVKRTSFELLKRIFYKNRKPSDFSVEKDYENTLFQALQDRREKILEATYKNIAMFFPEEILEDPHGVDLYRQNLALGFFPLTEGERNDIGMMEIFFWEGYGSVRAVMQDEYKDSLDDVIKEIGELRFSEFMRKTITSNILLTQRDKEQLLEKYTERNNYIWDSEATDHRFHRLALVMLGVLNYEPSEEPGIT